MIIDFSKDADLEVKTLNEFEIKVLNFINEWKSDNKTVQIKSSGSTGKPKVFEIEKTKMLNSAEMTCNFLNLEENNSALLCLPIEYISGKMMVVRSILKKFNLEVNEPSIQPLTGLHRTIDFCAMTPLQVENSLDKLHFIKNLIIGGASVSQSLKDKIYKSLNTKNTKVFETYGMSETLSHIALKEIFPNNEDWFTTFNNVDISIDERNCLKIFAPKVNSEILQTNDIVSLRNKNQFKFLGRADNVINSGGAKIYPEELEALVKKNISNEVLFLGLDDDELGQKLTLVIEGKENDALKKSLNQIIWKKRFHRPKQIVFIPEIPRTENGKVNRQETLALLKNLS